MQSPDSERIIYLDYAATTPVDRRVVDSMLPYFGPLFGNSASLHKVGRSAADAVSRAREQLANLLGCSPEDVVWTSGATEANNLAIKGTISALARPNSHVITQAIEHKAVLDPLATMLNERVEVTVLEVDSSGSLDPAIVEASLRPDTVLVTIMAANNELGTLSPLKEIGQICKNAGVVFHTDASQAVGKVRINMEELHIHLLSVSGHKLYGPKGIGALVFRKGPKLKRLTPLIDGGGHERGMRSGTLNVPAIVGLGKASEIALHEMADDDHRVRSLRNEFEAAILNEAPDTYVNGANSPRLPNISNVAFGGLDAESLLLALDRIAASTGSACTAASIEPSHVLKALGFPEERQRASVRFSFGRQSTVDEVREAVSLILPAVHSLRGLSSKALL